MQTPGPDAPEASDQFRTDAYELEVAAVTQEAEDVIAIVLRHMDGLDLPPWSPGAHIDLILPSEMIRQYSLCGSVRDRSTYRIAVLREHNGRGGSVELHDLPLVGRTLKVRGPRNHFELKGSACYVFIAGGIGITPILSMISAVPPEAAWTLHYGGRSLKSMAFVDEAKAIGGDRVHLVPEDEEGRIDLDSILVAVDGRTAIYCCGPPALLQAVEERKRVHAPDSKLYIERFTPAADRSIGVDIQAGSERGCVVELRRSNLVLTVPPDRTLLSVIRDALPDVAYSCEEGYCGTCETRVLEGVPDHRDDLLTDEERAAGKTMMTCVSRALSDRLVLDL
jgi:ferredoxin-NADP reductase